MRTILFPGTLFAAGIIAVPFGAAAPVADARAVTAWLNAYDFDAALASFDAHRHLIAEVGPQWFTLGAGSVPIPIPGSRVDDEQLLAIAETARVRLVPLITNAHPSGVDRHALIEMLSSPEARIRHADALAELVLVRGYDGINLDYEGLAEGELLELATLVEELAPRLHELNRTLAVSLEAHDRVGFEDAWRRIGEAADEVYVMAYGKPRKEPGPVTEFSWVVARLTDAVQLIPRRKLGAGLGVYGSWFFQNGRQRTATWQALADEKAERQDGVANRDPGYDEPWFRFSEGSEAWFEDGVSIARKAAAARSLGIARFALWRIGGEDPTLWESFK